MLSSSGKIIRSWNANALIDVLKNQLLQKTAFSMNQILTCKERNATGFSHVKYF